MRDLLDPAALLLTTGGLACLVLAVAVTGRWRPGLGFTLDAWTAAGLLRLAASPTWNRIAAAAAIIVVRRLVGLGLRAGAATGGLPVGRLGALGAAWRRPPVR